MKRLQIGKNGLTEAFIEQVKSIFKEEKIIKISILPAATRDREEAKKIAEQLINALGRNYTYKLIGYTLTVRKWRKVKR